MTDSSRLEDAVARAADPAHRIAVSYIDKSREYYAAQGYGNPYRWAHHTDSPFTPLRRPLAECTVALVTTASRMDTRDGRLVPPRGPKAVYSAPVKPAPERLYTNDLEWDKDATHTDDLDSFVPIHRLEEYVAEGRVGQLAPRFHGVPTDYSQRRTLEQDAPEILRRCREDGVDAALLVAL